MSTKQIVRDAFRSLSADEYYAAQISVAEMRLQSAIEAKQLHERIRTLNQEYDQQRRNIIPNTIDREIKKFNHQQREARRLLSERSTTTKEECDALKSDSAQLDKEATSYFQKLAVDYKALIALREAFLEKAELAFSETAGKGPQSVVKEHPPGTADNDPEFHPPFKLSYDECDPPDRVRSSLDVANGVIEANMRCSLRDCGNSESQAALYRNYWIFAGRASAGGQLSASIDLQPRHFHSIASVRDNNGSSAVAINRSFRVFAQLNVGELDHTEFPHLGGRVYGVQIISRPTSRHRYPDLSEKMPFYYKDEGMNIDPYDSSGEIIGSGPVSTTYTGLQVDENVWRYTVHLRDEIRQNQLFTGAIGIEFSNRVWGDDVTVYSELDFEFVTPRIAWEIV